jgi:hypothetical protein
MIKYCVREITDPSNVVMVGIQEECQSYCDQSNRIMEEDGAQGNIFEVVPM